MFADRINPLSRKAILVLVFAVLACLAQAACGTDSTPTYRYRLTVEVETPERLKTGSSVIEVRQRLVRPGSSPDHLAIERHTRGEAVAVDLPGGHTLFALLRSEDEPDWAASVVQEAAPKVPGEAFEDKFDNMLAIDGEVELPHRWPPVVGGLRLAAYPILVTFDDIDDPASVKLVDPDDLAATFGAGVQLRRITVQLTDDPVTAGIEEKLKWMDRYRKRHFNGASTVMEDMTTDDLTAHLSSGDFSTEFAR